MGPLEVGVLQQSAKVSQEYSELIDYLNGQLQEIGSKDETDLQNINMRRRVCCIPGNKESRTLIVGSKCNY
jgi:hypothetical protein